MLEDVYFFLTTILIFNENYSITKSYGKEEEKCTTINNIILTI